MTPKQRTSLSKLLSLVLRHDPAAIGIRLDSAGWVEVTTLLDALVRNGKSVSLDDLIEVVATNEKKRFAFSDDHLRVRANQGHSVEVDLGHVPSVPPSVLFHGTADRNIESIRKQGLLRMTRQHVHLSIDGATARLVGERHGRAVVLTVESGRMAADGHLFFLSANGVWLTEHVRASYIIIP